MRKARREEEVSSRLTSFRLPASLLGYDHPSRAPKKESSPRGDAWFAQRRAERGPGGGGGGERREGRKKLLPWPNLRSGFVEEDGRGSWD